MTQRKLAVVVLAAGEGTRMKSQRPKVLHELAGRSMLAHVLSASEALKPDRIVVVVGPGMGDIEKAAGPHSVAIQEKPLGTGHAVMAAKPALGDLLNENNLDILVIFGDTPLLRGETLSRLAETLREGPARLACLAFEPEDPARYGRVMLELDGRVARIVEYLDADETQRNVRLCNAGMMAGDARTLFGLLAELKSENAKGEYYLTDIFAMAHAKEIPAVSLIGDEEEVQGINDRIELARAEAQLQRRLRSSALAGGVTMIDPESVWLSMDTKLGSDILLEPNVFIGPGVEIENGATIRAFSHLEGAKIGENCTVGPYARLRPGTYLEKGSKIGNFVEVKNATLGEGAKANHLAYLGDASVGAKANIGAGSITCNYDGFAKHRSEIGEGVFIGSNCALVAPIKIGAGAIVGAGSTVVTDIEEDALVLARGEQKSNPGGAARLRARKKRD